MRSASAVIQGFSERRRRAIQLAGIAGLGLIAFTFAASRNDRTPVASRATPQEIAAFVNRAQTGLKASPSASYRVVLAEPPGSQVTVTSPSVPRALVAGLRRATVAYAGTQPAYLLKRRVDGRSARCLQFGRSSRPVGSVCTTTTGVVAFYNLPPTVTAGKYRVATLATTSVS